VLQIGKVNQIYFLHQCSKVSRICEIYIQLTGERQVAREHVIDHVYPQPVSGLECRRLGLEHF
jgi:hypothetical protein